VWGEDGPFPARRWWRSCAFFSTTITATRARPGEWAVVAEGDTQDFNRIIGYIRSGRGPFAPEKSFEARQRTELTKGARGGRTGRIYARYIGPTVGAR
jgi:hypothetical protein